MSAFSDYLESGIINVLRGTTFPLSATGSVYVSLHTATLNDDGTGTEVSAGGYARVAVSKATGSWDAPSGGATANTNTITFGPASANWGTVTHFGIWDASTTGNLLFLGALSSSRTVNDGDSATFAAGALTITVA